MALIPPTNENLESVRATRPLTEWLIRVAKSGTTMTYGLAKQRLEADCGFDVIFPVAVGRVAGAAMNRILEHVPDAPLLNVLLGKTASQTSMVAEERCTQGRPVARVGRGRSHAG